VSAHILIVEDDENIAHMIEATLAMGHYTSEIASDGSEAIAAMHVCSFDLILLDVMLPGKDGFEVFGEQGLGTPDAPPVIFLTAMDDVPSKVRGLRMGAEDYIVKPFESVELLARIEVVLRRSQPQHPALKYGAINIDPSRHLVTLRGKKVSLTPKEFDLLIFFVNNIDIALTRERLLSAVWGYDYFGETRTVDTHIQKLRRKLDLSDDLVTIPRLGYRLEMRHDQSNGQHNNTDAKEAPSETL